jgi:selenocysteine lyase/cysteine desulfurase
MTESLATRARDTGLTCQRDRFSLPTGEHYLNCAYMAPTSRRVAEAGIEAVRNGATPARLGAADFFRGCDTIRARFAELIGLDEPARVAVIPSVSYGMATIARNTTLARGQNVVTLEGQFPSNVHAWRSPCDSSEAELRVVRAPMEGRGRTAAWNEAILEAIDRDTALVAMGSVHWTDGTPFDLARIGERAREVGAAFVIDGTQSVGATPFVLARIRPDALVCAGYKWLTGPYSIGVAFFGDRYGSGTPLEETWMSREGSDEFAGLVQQPREYRPGAARYDVGEAANFILVPMLITALEQVLGWGVDGIAAYVRGLRDELLSSSRLQAIGIDAAEPGSGHLFGLRLPAEQDPERVRARLSASGVHVSVRGRVVRVSPHVYNDGRDLEALLRGFEAALA